MKKIKAENLQKGKCYFDYWSYNDGTKHYYFFKTDHTEEVIEEYSCYHQEFRETKTKVFIKSEISIKVIKNPEEDSKKIKISSEDTYIIFSPYREFFEVDERIINRLLKKELSLSNKIEIAEEAFRNYGKK